MDVGTRGSLVIESDFQPLLIAGLQAHRERFWTVPQNPIIYLRPNAALAMPRACGIREACSDDPDETQGCHDLFLFMGGLQHFNHVYRRKKQIKWGPD